MKQSLITAAELMAELEADPKWVAEKEKRERERRERVAAWRTAEAPLTQELNGAGFCVLV